MIFTCGQCLTARSDEALLLHWVEDGRVGPILLQEFTWGQPVCQKCALAVHLFVIPFFDIKQGQSQCKAAIDQVIQDKRSLPLRAWEVAIISALPVAADRDPTRVVHSEKGTQIAVFQGDVDKLKLVLDAVEKLKISLSEEFWMEAFLHAVPHCIESVYLPQQIICLQKSLGSLPMVTLLLEAMLKGEKILPLENFLTLLVETSLEPQMHVLVLHTFLTKIFEKDNACLETLATHPTLDPALAFFSEIFSWLMQNKKNRVVQKIASSILEKMAPYPHRVPCVINAMHLCGFRTSPL